MTTTTGTARFEPRAYALPPLLEPDAASTQAWMNNRAAEVLLATGLYLTEIKWTRAKSYQGMYRYRPAAVNFTHGYRPAVHELHLSTPWANATDRREANDTIVHEVAHGLVNVSGARVAGHGPEWLAQYRLLGGNGGAKGPLNPVEVGLRFKWIGDCGTGCKIGRDRLMANPENAICAKHRASITWIRNA